MSDLQEIITKVIAVYTIFVIVFGTLGNIFSIFICTRKELRSVPTFVFYAFLLGSDTISLYWWNLDHVYVAYYGYFLEDVSFDLCRLINFFQLFSFQTSAWILVSMTVERFLSVLITNWRRSIFNAKKAFYVALCIIVILFITELTFTLQITKTNKSDPNYNLTCFEVPEVIMNMQEHNYMFCFIPYTTMFLTNCFLMYRIKINMKSNKNAVKSKTTRTVIIFTSLYLIFSMPAAIIGAFFVGDLLQYDFGENVLFFSDCLVFTFTAFNVLVLYASNNRFANEVKKLFTRGNAFDKGVSKSGLSYAVKGTTIVTGKTSEELL